MKEPYGGPLPVQSVACVTVDVYGLVSDAVSTGAAFGVRRFFKHRDDDLSESEIDSLAESVEREVMNEICHYLDFPRREA